MIKEKSIFTREAVAAMSLEEKARYTFLDRNNNVAGLISAGEYPSVKAFGAARGWTSGKTAKEIALQPLADAVRKNAPPEYDEETVRARMEFSEETCSRYFKGMHNSGDSDNLANFQKRDPDAYRRLKISAISRGYRISAPRPVTPKPQPESDGNSYFAGALC